MDEREASLIKDIFNQLAISQTHLDHAENLPGRLPRGWVAELNLNKAGVVLDVNDVRARRVMNPLISMVRVEYPEGEILAFFQMGVRALAREVKLREVIAGDQGIFSFSMSSDGTHPYIIDLRKELEDELPYQDRQLLVHIRSRLHDFIIGYGLSRVGGVFRNRFILKNTVLGIFQVK